MKALHSFGVALALLLASATTVLAADPLPSTADILRGPYYGPSQGARAVAQATAPVLADVLRSPYEVPIEESPVIADVLREGYEEIWPYVAVDSK